MGPFARAILVTTVVGVLAACSNVGEPPGSRVEDFFEEWAAAWSSGDPYATVRFYAPDVSVPIAQTDLSLGEPAAWIDTATHGVGRAWFAHWLSFQPPSERSIDRVFISNDHAVATITIDGSSTAAWVGMEVGSAGIVEQSTLRWRDAHLPGGTVDTRLAWVDDLVAAYVKAWATTDDAVLGDLYAEDAAVDLGAGAATSALDTPAGALPDAKVAAITPGDRSGPAVFVFPSADTRYVAFVVDAEPDGCSEQVAIALTLDEDRRIIAEERLSALETIRTCDPGRLDAAGWWTDLTPPPALEEQVSGVLERPRGDQITIINGSPELERLLGWGLDRFVDAGLDEPHVDSATFAPVRACADRAGLVTEDDVGAPDLVSCTDAFEACLPNLELCSGFTVSARFGLLHELAHVWLLENLDEDHQATFMEFSGTRQWLDADLPWHERGAEVAAETVAWGLMDVPIALGRLDDPPCDRTARGYQLLTATPPLNVCPD